MGITVLDDPGRWDRFVTESPYGSVFHQWDVCRIVEKHTGFRFLPRGITRGNDLVAVVPLFSRRMHGIRIVASPPPMTGIPRMGVVMDRSFDTLPQYRKEPVLELIGTSLSEEIGILSPDHFLMTLPLGFHDVRIFQWLGFTVNPQYTYLYDLSRPLDQIWAEFGSSKRYHVRKARDRGATVGRGTGISELYHLMELRARHAGHPLALPGVSYLEDLVRTLPDQFRVYEVRHEGAVKGALLAALDRDMKMWLGAPKAMPGANELLHWTLIQEGKAANLPFLEDVGANTHHLTRFKNRFNPGLELYYTIMRRNLRGKVAERIYHAAKQMGRLGHGWGEAREWEDYL